MKATLRPRPSIEPRTRDGVAVALLAAIVGLPFVVATVRALSDGWLAVGDNGNFLIRSRDVLTAHHPLLGTWSSASIPLGENVNHPGPLLFDLFAIPAKLGGSGGLVVGVLLLHLACIGLVALFGLRIGGLRVAAAALAATAALAWTMGSQLLFDPWQPHTLLFPVLLLLVLVVAMAAGDTVALPVAAAVASLVVQTHLSYTLLVPPLCAYGLAWLIHRRRRDVVRPAIVAGIVLLVAWSQPIADQLAGEGNLGTLIGGIGSSGESIGASLGLRVASDVVAVPPWWARDSFARAIRVPAGQGPLVGERPNIAGLPSTTTALLALLGVVALLVLAWWITGRRRDPRARVAVAAGAVALAVGLAVTVTLPVGGVGVPPHQVRYLWPLALFVTAVVALALVPRQRARPAFALAAVALALLTLPTYDVQQGPNDDADAIPVLRALAGQLDSMQDEGTVLYDTSALRFAEPWTSGLLAVFQEQGIDFALDDPVWIRQLGDGRADEGDADARVFVREGDAAVDVPSGIRRVAYVEGLDREEQRELDVLERGLVDLDVELNDAGRAALERGFLPALESGVPMSSELLAYGELAALHDAGLLEVPAGRAGELDRYTELRRRWDRHTVALFLDPTPYP